MGDANAALRIQATMTSTLALLHDPVKFIGCVMASYLERKFAIRTQTLNFA